MTDLTILRPKFTFTRQRNRKGWVSVGVGAFP